MLSIISIVVFCVSLVLAVALQPLISVSGKQYILLSRANKKTLPRAVYSFSNTVDYFRLPLGKRNSATSYNLGFVRNIFSQLSVLSGMGALILLILNSGKSLEATLPAVVVFGLVGVVGSFVLWLSTEWDVSTIALGVRRYQPGDDYGF